MKYIDELCERRKNLNSIKKDIENAFLLLKNCYDNNNKVLVCGNGGSSSDSSHIVGELMKGFKLKRKVSKNFSNEMEKVINEFTLKKSSDNGKEKFEEMLNYLEQGLPAIDITSQNALNTAYANDKDAKYMYANAILGLGICNDILIAISTSGNSINVINACIVAKAKNMKIIALTGRDGGEIKNIADVAIIVDEKETYLIQEEHIAIYHAICLDIEKEFFSE